MQNRIRVMARHAAVSSLALIGLAVGAARPASADLVVNGGFEDQVIANNSFTQTPTIPGWTLSFGTKIEIQRNVAGSPFEGNQLLELDSNAISGVYQDINTVIGQTYDFTFAFSARPRVKLNSMDVVWNGSTIASLDADGSSLTNTAWNVFTYKVTADKTVTRLGFNGTNPSDSLGSYVDGVTVNPAVPEPASLAMMGTGIVGAMGYLRRRRSAQIA